MATNILGIGIANAIGFRRKNLGGGHIFYLVLNQGKLNINKLK